MRGKKAKALRRQVLDLYGVDTLERHYHERQIRQEEQKLIFCTRKALRRLPIRMWEPCPRKFYQICKRRIKNAASSNS